MPPRKWTEELITRMEQEGIGQGFGADYRPWLAVQTLSSRGLSRRVWSKKTQREHHLLSNVEFNLFLCLEWASDVVDIREQFPLSRELTLAAADSLGIRHPHYPGTQVPTVMTVDFMVTRVHHGRQVFEAFNAKTEDEAEDDLSLQKLELQREVCSLTEVTHHLIFDTAIPNQVAANISWLRDALPKPGDADFRSGYLDELSCHMESELWAKMPAQTVRDFCAKFDRCHGLQHGLGLRVIRMLLYKRILKADMQFTDLAAAHLSTFTMTGSQANLRVVGGV